MPLLPPLHTDPRAPLPWEPRSWERGELIGISLLLAAIAVLIDQASKELAAVLLFPPGVTREIPGPFTLQLTYNDGGAYGMPLPSEFFLVVTAVVTWFVSRQLPRATTVLQASALGLLLAGAWGNALDRIFRVGDADDPRFFYGHVVDFMASDRLPTWNIADAWILTGFAMLVVALFLEDHAAARAGVSGRAHVAGSAG